MVTCFIGLHHIPEDKIDDFLQSIRRVLRPGGSFMLVDHDVTNDNTLDLAHLAHSTYNAVMGISELDEKNEIRNFRSMQYWSEKLEKHGFGKSVTLSQPMIRKDDPTKNTMLRFVNHKELSPESLINIERKRDTLIKNHQHNLKNKLLDYFQKLKSSIVISLLFGSVLKLGQALQIGMTRTLTTTSIGLASVAAFITVNIAFQLRNKFSKYQYEEYKNKTEQDFKHLSSTQREAFNLGDKASKSYTVQASSIFSKPANMAPNAYYAGFESGLKNDTELKRKLNTL